MKNYYPLTSMPFWQIWFPPFLLAICYLFLYETNMSYLLFLVSDWKNLKCQTVSILRGFFFIFYKNHFKLAIWLHTRTAPFSTIQLNSNILCRVFIHSNTISKIILALLRFYVYLIDNFSNFQSRFSIRCNKYFIELLKAIYYFSSNYIVCL